MRNCQVSNSSGVAIWLSSRSRNSSSPFCRDAGVSNTSIPSHHLPRNTSRQALQASLREAFEYPKQRGTFLSPPGGAPYADAYRGHGTLVTLASGLLSGSSARSCESGGRLSDDGSDALGDCVVPQLSPKSSDQYDAPRAGLARGSNFQHCGASTCDGAIGVSRACSGIPACDIRQGPREQEGDFGCDKGDQPLLGTVAPTSACAGPDHAAGATAVFRKQPGGSPVREPAFGAGVASPAGWDVASGGPVTGQGGVGWGRVESSRDVGKGKRAGPGGERPEVFGAACVGRLEAAAALCGEGALGIEFARGERGHLASSGGPPPTMAFACPPPDAHKSVPSCGAFSVRAAPGQGAPGLGPVPTPLTRFGQDRSEGLPRCPPPLPVCPEDRVADVGQRGLAALPKETATQASKRAHVAATCGGAEDASPASPSPPLPSNQPGGGHAARGSSHPLPGGRGPESWAWARTGGSFADARMWQEGLLCTKDLAAALLQCQKRKRKSRKGDRPQPQLQPQLQPQPPLQQRGGPSLSREEGYERGGSSQSGSLGSHGAARAIRQQRMELHLQIACSQLSVLQRWEEGTRELAARWVAWLLKMVRKVTQLPRSLQLLLFSVCSTTLPRMADSLLAFPRPRAPTLPSSAAPDAAPTPKLARSVEILVRGLERSRLCFSPPQWECLKDPLSRCRAAWHAATAIDPPAKCSAPAAVTFMPGEATGAVQDHTTPGEPSISAAALLTRVGMGDGSAQDATLTFRMPAVAERTPSARADWQGVDGVCLTPSLGEARRNPSGEGLLGAWQPASAGLRASPRAEEPQAAPRPVRLLSTAALRSGVVTPAPSLGETLPLPWALCSKGKSINGHQLQACGAALVCPAPPNDGAAAKVSEVVCPSEPKAGEVPADSAEELLPEPRAIAALVQQVLRERLRSCLEEERLIQRAKFVEGSPSGVGEAGLKVPLLCPISSRRMKVPARATSCRHRACFDLAAYLEAQATLALNSEHSGGQQAGLWHCPVCHCVAPWSRLMVDGLLLKILESTSEAVTAVLLLPDATWKLLSSTQALPGPEAPDAADLQEEGKALDWLSPFEAPLWSSRKESKLSHAAAAKLVPPVFPLKRNSLQPLAHLQDKRAKPDVALTAGWLEGCGREQLPSGPGAIHAYYPPFQGRSALTKLLPERMPGLAATGLAADFTSSPPGGCNMASTHPAAVGASFAEGRGGLEGSLCCPAAHLGSVEVRVVVPAGLVKVGLEGAAYPPWGFHEQELRLGVSERHDRASTSGEGADVAAAPDVVALSSGGGGHCGALAGFHAIPYAPQKSVTPRARRKQMAKKG